VQLDIGSADPYDAIGRGLLNIEFMPGVRDSKGFFGTPTSDSVRTMVTNQTTKLLLVFYDFYGNDSLDKAMEYAKEMLIKHCSGKEINTSIISFD
jgi:DNA/RNA-binding domain of Phe-tRNA-synthetase-like protein